MATYILRNDTYVNTPNGLILYRAGRLIDDALNDVPLSVIRAAGGSLTPTGDPGGDLIGAHLRRVAAVGGSTGEPNVPPWTSDNGIVAVKDLAALGLLPITFLDGVIVFVETLRDYFHYFNDPQITFSPDGITVIDALGGGSWMRMNLSRYFWPRIFSQVYIDPVNGNDENIGVQPSVALKTGAEYFRRTGPGCQIADVVTIFVMGSGVNLTLSSLYMAGGSIEVRGVIDQSSWLHFGQLGGKTDLNPNAAPSGQLTIINEGGVDFTPWINKRVIFPNGGSATIISAPALGSAVISSPLKRSPNSRFTQVPFTLNGNEIYHIVPAMFDITITQQDTSENLAFSQYSGPGLVIQYLAPQAGFAPSSGTVLHDCDIDTVFSANGLVTYANCYFKPFAVLESLAHASFTGGYFNGAVPVHGNESQVTYYEHPVFKGCSPLTVQGSRVEYHNAPFALNCANFMYAKDGGVVFDILGACGSGNTGSFLRVDPGGARIETAGTPMAWNVTMASGVEVTINGKTSLPAVNITNPYAYTADRALSFANLNASVAAAGFGGTAFDPQAPVSGIFKQS